MKDQLITINKFTILILVSMLSGCVSKPMNAAEEAVKVTERRDKEDYFKYKYSAEWLPLKLDIFENNTFIRLNDAEAIKNSDEEKITKVWSKMIFTNPVTTKETSVGDYVIQLQEFNCRDITGKQLAFYLYDGKTDRLKSSHKLNDGHTSVVPGSNWDLVFRKACEFRRLDLSYNKK